MTVLWCNPNTKPLEAAHSNIFYTRECININFRIDNELSRAKEFWLGLQLEYDLRVARAGKQKDIDRAVRPRSEAA